MFFNIFNILRKNIQKADLYLGNAPAKKKPNPHEKLKLG